MLSKTILLNKKAYLTYNEYRKQIFTQLAPKESEAILHLLPWLISVNHPAVPGYVKNVTSPFKVYNIDANREICSREQTFKRLFNIRGSGSLLKFSSQTYLVKGIYTIGSVGSIGQTSRSDCDIWICIDKREFDDATMLQFRQKVNLIKDWLDSTIRMPIYFFISDIEDIRNCNFGCVDYESCGSTQRNVLKEEFYRTSILICGKIPFWWVCYDAGENVDYEAFVSDFHQYNLDDYDFIDFGDLESIRKEEYFGAALWQYNKSLTHPLKSIIKMLLLKMLLESPKEELLCNKMRRIVLENRKPDAHIDPSTFTMIEVFEYAKNLDSDTFAFIQECFYLCYEIKLHAKNPTLKEEVVGNLFKRYKIDREAIYRLNEFMSWDFHEQLLLGEQILALLITIYKDIAAIQQGISGDLAPEDLTIIGRKLSSCLEKKPYKIPLIQKPIDNLTMPSLIFRFHGKGWQVIPSMDSTSPIVANLDIIYCIAHVVWNDIYLQSHVRMLPNSTPVTIQGIMSLATKMKEVFNTCDVSSISFEHFLAEEKFLKLLLIVSFEGQNAEIIMNDLCLLYQNNWGELFLRRFPSLDKLKSFLLKNQERIENQSINYYIWRSSLYYEKIIERTKSALAQIITGKHI